VWHEAQASVKGITSATVCLAYVLASVPDPRASGFFEPCKGVGCERTGVKVVTPLCERHGLSSTCTATALMALQVLHCRHRAFVASAKRAECVCVRVGRGE
jgi:hypothetical protein